MGSGNYSKAQLSTATLSQTFISWHTCVVDNLPIFGLGSSLLVSAGCDVDSEASDTTTDCAYNGSFNCGTASIGSWGAGKIASSNET